MHVPRTGQASDRPADSGSSHWIYRDLVGGTVVGVIVVAVMWYAARRNDAALEASALCPLGQIEYDLSAGQDNPEGVSTQMLRQAAADIDAVMTALAQE